METTRSMKKGKREIIDFVPRSITPKTLYYRQRKYTKGRNNKYNTAYFQLRATLNASSSVGGAIVATFPGNPALWDGTNPFPEFTTLQSLYDQYKLLAQKVQWVPDKPNDTSTTTNYKPMYSAWDEDSQFVPASADEVIQYKNSKVHPLYMPFSRYQKIPKVSKTSTGFVSGDGFVDIGTPNNQGSMSFYASGLDTSDNYGVWIITQYICCRGRR